MTNASPSASTPAHTLLFQSVTPVFLPGGDVPGDSSVIRDPAASSLQLMPTGRTLPSGNLTVGLAAPYLPYAAYCPVKGIQLSAGGIYIFNNPILKQEAYYSYFIVKDALFEVEGMSIAVGGAVMFWGQKEPLPAPPHWRHAVIPGVFGVTTIGTADEAVTLGVGFANTPGGFEIGLDAGILGGIGFGYEWKASRTWRLMTEHLIDIGTGNTLHTFGARLFGTRGAFDFGLVILPHGPTKLRVFPVIGVSVRIGPDEAP